MNKDRRKEIADIIERISALEDLKTELHDSIESIRDEEQEYFDNMPESFQMADRGQAAQQAIDSLDEAMSALDDIDTDALTSSLETAAE